MADVQMVNDAETKRAGAGEYRRTQNPGGAGDEIQASVVGDDAIAADGVRMYLHATAGIRVVPREQAREADVVVVVTTTLSEELLATMHEVRQATVNSRQCMVLVSDTAADRYLARAFRHGVVSIIPRRSATRESIVQAVLASGRGSAVLPGPVTRWLADSGRDFEQVVMSAHGIVAGGLTVRETDVLRLLADGMSTAEIARQLNYAERTIKNVIAEMLSRLRLRNRIQAVAYAYRVGAI